MSNYTLPPRSKASDYAKGKITQDEIIALQIANDANISAARKAIKMGEVKPLTPLESASPAELLADDAAQEAMARTNLERLGFRPQEAADITTNIRRDAGLDFTSLNANFPAIETDIKSKFNPKLITPAFFIEYLKQYSQELLASKGVTNGGLASISRNINALINSVVEIRSILPEAAQMTALIRNVDRIRLNTSQRALLEPILERIRDLEVALPSSVDYDRIERLNAVAKQEIIQELQTATADLPSKEEVNRILRSVEDGRQEAYTQLVALADSVDNQLKPNLNKILREVRELGDIQNELAFKLDKEPLGTSGTSGTSGKPAGRPITLNNWEKEDPIIDNEVEWNNLNGSAKKKFIRSRIDLGENIKYNLDGRIYDVTVGFLNANSKVDIFDGIWRDWVSQFASSSSSSSGAAPKSSGATDSSLASGSTSSGVAGLFGKGIRPSTIKIGRGLSVKETPSYREYGKYAIHIPQLEQQDLLNVKYKSLGQIPKFKPIPVSDIFRDFILDLLENGKPNARVYTQIAPEERKFFEEMSIGAGVWNGLGLKRTTTSTDEEENKRFELLRGEYVSGNNNPKVISELRRLVVKMMSDGRIRKNQGLELLMELSI
jgi:hypothetical protein